MSSTLFQLLDEFSRYTSLIPPHLSAFRDGLAAPMPTRGIAPKDLPVTASLDRCAAIAAAGRPLAAMLAGLSDDLRWGQTYTAEDFGAGFLDSYGWVELFGTRGHFACDHMAGGFLLLGPGTTYRDHHHLAEEIYIPLTGGTDWRQGTGEFREHEADSVIHHPSNVPHAMRTGAEPLLALYLWRGGPLDQKSVVSGA